ncbi:MAG: hypothetical protein FWH56_06155 [Betaproteobacteria bacterium]|nr:hypothetical protein [Betaproteobacteria bacterium]
MAGALKLDLTFHSPIGVADRLDCGTRTAIMPLSLPRIGDDFVWEARDFDGFRMAMLEELAARFPERSRWTPADLEVVLVEVLSWALDQLSDMLDRVTAEAYLETARRPESVHRLLSLIGYETPDWKKWSQNPVLMEAARRAGPKSVRQQRRMVSVDDTAETAQMHPLVRRAVSTTCWNGSWHCILVTVILWGWKSLDSSIAESGFLEPIKAFHEQHGLLKITDENSREIRVIDSLMAWADSRRMAGQEILFGEAVRVGVDIRLDITVAPQYYHSEVLQAVRTIFNAQEGGFFEIGRLSFGTDLNRGDVIQAVMQLEGIESVAVKTFKRSDSDSRQPENRIVLEGVEVAVCDNDPKALERGVLVIECSGGLKG